MGSTPLPTTNKTAAGVDTAIADGTLAAEQAVEKAAEASAPFLAFPFIKQCFEAFANWLMGVASKTGQLALTFVITRVQTAEEGSALDQANKAVEAAILSGDANAITSAEAAFQKAQSSAVNSDGSAQPQ